MTPTSGAGDAPASARPDWATIPNLVTLLRFLLLAPACWVILDEPEGRWLPPVLIGIWAVTDWVDGLLARLLDQRSRTGEILDPIADRIGIGFVVVALGVAGALSWWPVAIIFGVDVLVLALAGRAAQQGRMKVTKFGKARTAVLFFGIGALVLGISVWPSFLTVGQVLIWVGVAMHLYAATTYLRAARLGTGPAVRRRPVDPGPATGPEPGPGSEPGPGPDQGPLASDVAGGPEGTRG